MAATDDAYDDITSDELFDSFMDVVNTVELNETNDSNTYSYGNVYEKVDDFNHVSTSNQFTCKDAGNVATCYNYKYSDSQAMPLLVRLSAEPIYETCGGRCDSNNDLGGDDDRLSFSDPDSSMNYTGKTVDQTYSTIDELVPYLPPDASSHLVHKEGGVDMLNEDSSKNSNKTDRGIYNSSTNLQSDERISSSNSVGSNISEVGDSLSTHIHSLTNEDDRFNLSDTYSVLEVETNLDITNIIDNNETKRNIADLYAVVDKSSKASENNNSLCNEQTIHSNDNLYDKISAVTDNMITNNDSEYETIESCRTLHDNSTVSENLVAPRSPEIVYNAEQIAYGFQQYRKESEDRAQEHIKLLEKRDSTQPTSAKATKDKRHFFGFGRWKSTEDNSKSSNWFSLSDEHKMNAKSSPPSPVANVPEKAVIPVVCSGYLFKQGGSGFTPKNWRLRWFQLKKDNCLYYYKSEQDHIPNGAVMLLRYTVSRTLEVNKRFAFKVSKGEARTYYFAANSEEEMRKWMVYLNEAAKCASADPTAIPDCSLKNVSIPAVSIADPDCHGFISKQGNMHKSWKKRYCVLKYGCLFYYEDMSDKVAIGVFKLHKYTINKSENIKNGIEAVPPARKMRTYYFSTDTESETRRWIDAMKRSISSF